MNPLVGQGMGIVSDTIAGAVNNNQNKKAQERQFRLQNQLNEQNQARAKEMWEFTNYGNQVKQMEEAGLNVGLMYGSGGGGGTTTNGGGGGSVASQAPSSFNSSGGQGMGLAVAQMENIQALTEKTRAETIKLTGADTANTEAQTASLLQGINNQKAQQVLTEVQSNIASLEERIKGDSIEEAIKYAKGMADYQSKQIEGLGYQNSIDKATVGSKIDIVKAEAVGAVIRNELTRAQVINTGQSTEESKARINKMVQDVAQGWQGLDNEARNIKINKFKADLESQYPSILKVGGNAVNGIMRGLHEILGINPDQNYKKQE